MRTLPVILAVLLAVGLWAGTPARAGGGAAGNADSRDANPHGVAAPAVRNATTDGPRPAGDAVACANRPADALVARGSPRVDSPGPVLTANAGGVVDGPAAGRAAGPLGRDGPSHGRAPLSFPLLI